LADRAGRGNRPNASRRCRSQWLSDNWLDQDLIIDYFEIPMAQRSLTDKEPQKYTSIYFPRTLDRLLELYDMIVVCEEEWVLMVRRRLFKEVSVTRFQS
jgi:hypothetical protein